MRPSGLVAFLAGGKAIGPNGGFARLLKFLSYVAVALIAVLLTLLVINLIPEPRVLRAIVPHRFEASNRQFPTSMSGYSQGQLSDSNAVQTLVNGDEIFP
ncbi:hypothetical protein [Mesorhizobium sp.]|uniref:hypothetical protein n=1 Tax=Mesorhizobium sp. TaxID=1871066 RepID=UPI0025C4A0F1|nr:hypothetical protein [Mesorhizobium sp.]